MQDVYTTEEPNETVAGSAAKPLVELRNIGVRFGSHQVLRNISLTIPRGQSLAIVGQSGSGKSVLMKTTILLVRPTEGDVFFDGQNLKEMNAKRLSELRRRIGFLFQQAALFDSLTVWDNIAFPLKQHTKMSVAEMDEVIRAHLTEVGLGESVLDKKPAELSGGMRKRVGLARAVVLKPELMLYDEPTSGLDPIMSDAITRLIVDTHKRHGVTSIMVTHDMKSAQMAADRIVMISNLDNVEHGDPQILVDGPPEMLNDHPDPRVRNFVEGRSTDETPSSGS